jgi:hypothetical protein
MTTEQFLVLIGTIWIAPTVIKPYGQFAGSLVLIIAALKGLGWI